jgi:succinate dehydrogenase / fumarate reductase cytochrome b subunit
MAQTISSREPVTGTASTPKKRKPFLLDLYGTAVGKKYVMAVTGIIGIGFVVVHMIGNLKIYLGADAEGVYEIDHYGEFLRELLVPLLPRTGALWLLRIGLIVAFFFHIHAAYGLTRMNQRARGTGYEHDRDFQAAGVASRTMRWTGIVVALFLIFHPPDRTWGTANPDFVRGDVYRNFVASFDRPVVTAIYVVANLALAIHLFHGCWSMFQSLGLNNPKWNSWRRGFAIGFASLIGLINVTLPLAVTFDVVNADDTSECRKQGDVIVTCEEYETEEAQS